MRKMKYLWRKLQKSYVNQLNTVLYPLIDLRNPNMIMQYAVFNDIESKLRLSGPGISDSLGYGVMPRLRKLIEESE